MGIPAIFLQPLCLSFSSAIVVVIPCSVYETGLSSYVGSIDLSGRNNMSIVGISLAHGGQDELLVYVGNSSKQFDRSDACLHF